MDLIYEIEAHIIDLTNLAMTYAEPYMLEIMVFLVFSTFALSFISTYK